MAEQKKMIINVKNPEYIWGTLWGKRAGNKSYNNQDPKGAPIDMIFKCCEYQSIWHAKEEFRWCLMIHENNITLHYVILICGFFSHILSHDEEYAPLNMQNKLWSNATSDWILDDIIVRMCDKSYQNSIKGACFQSTRSLNGVSMHWITDPCHDLSRPTNSSDQVGKLHSHILSTHSNNDCNPSWLVIRIKDFNEFN